MSLSVSLAHLDAIPLAVVRRRARRAERGAVVQRGCGDVWNYRLTGFWLLQAAA